MSKKKKSFTLLAVLVAILALGIGYAAVSTINLRISGSATATGAEEGFDVKFTGTPTSTKSSGSTATVTPAITNDTTASINVTGMTKVDEEVTATYTVLNNSEELAAIIKNVTVSSNTESEYFDVTAALAGSASTVTLQPAETTTVAVTVKLKKLPLEDKTTTIEVTFAADPAEKTTP